MPNFHMVERFRKWIKSKHQTLKHTKNKNKKSTLQSWSCCKQQRNTIKTGTEKWQIIYNGIKGTLASREFWLSNNFLSKYLRYYSLILTSFAAPETPIVSQLVLYNLFCSPPRLFVIFSLLFLICCNFSIETVYV